MGFFKPAWMNKDSYKAMDAVYKITDQPKLAEIALATDDHKVRTAAINGLAPDMLVQVMQQKSNCTYGDFISDCMKVLEKKDKELVLRLFLDTSSPPPIRSRAFQLIQDGTIINAAALRDSEFSIRCSAIKREQITLDTLVKILCGSKDIRVGSPYYIADKKFYEVLSNAKAKGDITEKELMDFLSDSDLSSRWSVVSSILPLIHDDANIDILNSRFLNGQLSVNENTFIENYASLETAFAIALDEKRESSPSRHDALKRIREIGDAQCADRLKPLLCSRQPIDGTNARLGRLSIIVFAGLKRKSMYEAMAEDGNEAFLDEQIKNMQSHGPLVGDFEDSIEYVRAFYRAGKFTEKINASQWEQFDKMPKHPGWHPHTMK